MEGYTFVKTVDSVECLEEQPTLYTPLTSFGKETQRITLRFKAKGFLQYQIRMMTGAMLQVAKGDLTLAQVSQLLAQPDSEHKDIPRSCAAAHGLTLIDVLYKDNHLFKEPQDISEGYFMRGHKRRLEKLGIIYEPPNPDTDQAVGSLFD